MNHVWCSKVIAASNYRIFFLIVGVFQWNILCPISVPVLLEFEMVLWADSAYSLFDISLDGVKSLQFFICHHYH